MKNMRIRRHDVTAGLALAATPPLRCAARQHRRTLSCAHCCALFTAAFGVGTWTGGMRIFLFSRAYLLRRICLCTRRTTPLLAALAPCACTHACIIIAFLAPYAGHRSAYDRSGAGRRALTDNGKYRNNAQNISLV